MYYMEKKVMQIVCIIYNIFYILPILFPPLPIPETQAPSADTKIYRYFFFHVI